MQTYPLGIRIGQYEIASLPMMGGMGVVYFALDHGNDGRPVALKTFRPELLPDRAARDRFLREGTVWINLGKYPHIVHCYDVLNLDPEVYLVLELIVKEEGRQDASLRSWLIPGKSLPMEQSLLFALQIARAMRYATAVVPGLVHRDLKPENLLIGADLLPYAHSNRLRVTDFGLAKVVGEGSSRPMADPSEVDYVEVPYTRFAGTPLYMAPEQWLGRPITAATDIYAFGCILYEMLVGKRVVTGKNLAELEQAHFHGKAHTIAVGDFLAHCLEVDPGDRYGDWGKVEVGIDDIYHRTTGNDSPEPIAENDTRLSEKINRGASYLALGRSYLDISLYDLAIPYFEQAVKIERILQEDVKQAGGKNAQEQSLILTYQNWINQTISAGLMCLSLAYLNLHDEQRSRAYLEEYLQLPEGTLGKGISGAGDLLMLGDLNLTRGNISQAQEFYEQALSAATDTNDLIYKGKILHNLGKTYTSTGHPQQARQYLEQALSIVKDTRQKDEEAQVLQDLWHTYRETGFEQQAQACLERWREVVQNMETQPI
jgi:serine/threonine protein kinase